MLGDVLVNHMVALAAQHDEDVKNPKRDGGDGEEVDAGKPRSLITEECPPTLRRWPSPAAATLPNSRFAGREDPDPFSVLRPERERRPFARAFGTPDARQYRRRYVGMTAVASISSRAPSSRSFEIPSSVMAG